MPARHGPPATAEVDCVQTIVNAPWTGSARCASPPCRDGAGQRPGDCRIGECTGTRLEGDWRYRSMG